MYGVPSDLDLTGFYGANLNQICLGPFDLAFNFSTGMHISVEGLWELREADGSLIDGSEGKVADKPGNRSRRNWQVRSLLADTVVSGDVDAPRSFTLVFASGRRLTIFDDPDAPYESFSIQPGDIFV